MAAKLIEKLIQGNSLTEREARTLMNAIMSGEATEGPFEPC